MASGVSKEAGVIVQMAERFKQDVERSQALFGDKTATISSLNELACECAEADWDGYGAQGMDPAAVTVAERLIRALPMDIPMPECAPEPDGSISLDWWESRYRIVSVSVSPSARLAFAWLDGTDRGHAVARFDGSAVPERLLQEIRRIMPNASLRAA